MNNLVISVLFASQNYLEYLNNARKIRKFFARRFYIHFVMCKMHKFCIFCENLNVLFISCRILLKFLFIAAFGGVVYEILLSSQLQFDIIDNCVDYNRFHMAMNPDDNNLISFPKIEDARGNLSFIQYPDFIPFPIARAYWVYDVPGGESREGHAYHEQREVIVALSGAFDVKVDDGEKEVCVHLSRSYYGLLVNPGVWRQLTNFSTNSVALILSSTDYDECDYIRDKAEFLRLKKEGRL